MLYRPFLFTAHLDLSAMAYEIENLFGSPPNSSIMTYLSKGSLLNWS